MLPDLTSLELLRLAVLTGNLSRAAERMHITVSAASRRITMLEHQLKMDLFTRIRGGGIDPTPAGLIAAKSVEKIMLEVLRMQQALAEYDKGIVGHVRLYAATTAMGYGLPQEIALFGQAHPAIRVELRELRSSDIPSAVRDGDADVGIVMEGGVMDGLRVEGYKEDRLCAVVANDHPICASEALFEALLDYDFIGLDSNALQTSLMMSAATMSGKQLKMHVLVQSFEALCRMVDAKLGIGVLSEIVAQSYISSLNIRPIRLKDTWVQRKVMLCTRQGRLDGPTEELLAFLMSRRSSST